MTEAEMLKLLTPIAADQAGYVTSQQALAGGADHWMLRNLAKRGLLRRVRRGVYMVEPGRAASANEEIISAWLAVDPKALPYGGRMPSALVSHASAATLLKLGTIIPELPEVTVARQIKQRPDMRTHVAAFGPEDWQWLRLDEGVRVAVTTPARTIVDLYLADEEIDYLERAIRESVPGAEEASRELRAAAKRRRPGRAQAVGRALTRLAEDAWAG
jgi:predicted transcriptional regulator of viral defense system